VASIAITPCSQRFYKFTMRNCPRTICYRRNRENHHGFLRTLNKIASDPMHKIALTRPNTVESSVCPTYFCSYYGRLAGNPVTHADFQRAESFDEGCKGPPPRGGTRARIQIAGPCRTVFQQRRDGATPQKHICDDVPRRTRIAGRLLVRARDVLPGECTLGHHGPLLNGPPRSLEAESPSALGVSEDGARASAILSSVS